MKRIIALLLTAAISIVPVHQVLADEVEVSEEVLFEESTVGDVAQTEESDTFENSGEISEEADVVEKTDEEGTALEMEVAEDGEQIDNYDKQGLLFECLDESTMGEVDTVIYCDEIFEEVQQLEEYQDGLMSFEDALEAVDKGSSITNSEWDQYASNYVYNMLPDNKKNVWKQMDKLCLDAINNKTDLNKGLGKIVSSAFSSKQDLAYFFMMYKYTNPQYYFLSSSFWYGYEKGVPYVNWYIYPNMQNGSSRAEYTRTFKSGIDKFANQITGDTEYEKVKSVTDLICSSVVYDTQEDRNGYPNEIKTTSHYTQSAYSTLINGKTVCAGYTLATELLLNKMGIDSMGVTSSYHAWNKVKVYNTWYSLDNTWIDNEDSKFDYSYFLVADNAKAYSANRGQTIETYWRGYNPAAVNDSGSSKDGAIEPAKPGEKVATPVISLNGGKITISCPDSGASIYYSINGGNPSVSGDRCNYYSGAFLASGVRKVKAIAVQDGLYDSDFAEFEQTIGTWIKEGNKYKYKRPDGSMAVNCWEDVAGTWYHFNKSGFMDTGWIKSGKSWYYLATTGEMVTGWQKVGNKWYYLNDDGSMATGWKQIDNKWYYLNASGVMATGWQKVGNKWYYLNTNGTMAAGWMKINKKWYYMGESGAMCTGWIEINGKWYYLYADGHMAVNEWVNKKYYVNGSGVWTKSR